MKFLEKDLETIIFEQLQTEEGCQKLYDRGLDAVSSKPYFSKQQQGLGCYGALDLITFDRAIIQNRRTIEYAKISIWELKQDEININALIQACRYVKAVNYFLKNSKNYYEFKIILIGKRVNLGDWVYLFDFADIEQYVYIYTYDYGIDGITFDLTLLSDYNLTNKGFEPKNFKIKRK